MAELERIESQDGGIEGSLKALKSPARSFTSSKNSSKDSALDTVLEPSISSVKDDSQDGSMNSAAETSASLGHQEVGSKYSTMERLFEGSSSLNHAREVSLVGALDGPPPHQLGQQGEWLSIHNEEDAFENVKMIQLTPSDHSYVCQAIGATSLDESHTLLYTKSFWWPPKGLPDGLYKDVISARILSQFRYHACSVFFNFSLVAQYE